MLAVLLMLWAMGGSAGAQTYPTARWYYEPQFEPPERQVDMLHMRLELSFVPAEALVRGTVTHRFTPLRQRVDSLFFDGPRIRVLAASYNGKPARFTTTPEGIVVYLTLRPHGTGPTASRSATRPIPAGGSISSVGMIRREQAGSRSGRRDRGSTTATGSRVMMSRTTS